MNLDCLFPPKLVLQVIRSIHCNYLSLVDYGNVIAEIFSFLQDMRCKKYRQSILYFGFYKIKQSPSCRWVKAHRWLIQEQEIHVMHKFTCNLHPSPLANGYVIILFFPDINKVKCNK